MQIPKPTHCQNTTANYRAVCGHIAHNAHRLSCRTVSILDIHRLYPLEPNPVPAISTDAIRSSSVLLSIPAQSKWVPLCNCCNAGTRLRLTPTRRSARRGPCVSKHRELANTNEQLNQNGCEGATDAMLADAYARPQRGRVRGGIPVY